MAISFKRLAAGAADLLYPKNIYCLCCGDTMESSRVHGICDVCAKKIHWNTADPFRHAEADHSFDRVWPCCRYGFYPRRIIASFKLGGHPYAAEPLGLLLSERLAMEDTSGCLLAAVPMHKEKEALRGFNQSELLALEAAKHSGLKHLPGLLIKERATRSMRLSDGVTRRTLYHNDFSVSEAFRSEIAGRHIILVDDVVTTGSTADACAHALKQAGASQVSVLCFACAPEQIFMDTQGQNDV